MTLDKKHLHPAFERMPYLLAIALVLLVAFWLGFNTRYLWADIPPEALPELSQFELSPYFIGFLLELKLIPVVLIYLLSILPYFRPAFQNPALPGARNKILIGLLVVQFISQSYGIWFSQASGEPFFGELLVVIVGGLLGGWKVGLVLGLFNALYQGTYSLLIVSPLKYHILEEARIFGLSKALSIVDWWQEFKLQYVNLSSSMGIWIGLIAGLFAGLLGRYRFTLLAAMGAGVIAELIAGYLRYVAHVPPGHLITFPSMLVTGLATTTVVLMVRSLQAEAARRKAEASELALAQAELRALRAQINPHFLFNSLNTIRYAIRTDPEGARRLLLNLSEIFQRALRAGEFVQLRDELSYVQAYLSLEKARLGDRLQVTCCGKILGNDHTFESESPLLDHLVPTLTIQPLVENAIIHGVSKKPEGGIVQIDFQEVNGDLLIEVKDNGIGIKPDRMAEIFGAEDGPTKSLGLRNIDGRLRALYGDDHHLKIESPPEGGTRVEVRIPLD